MKLCSTTTTTTQAILICANYFFFSFLVGTTLLPSSPFFAVMAEEKDLNEVYIYKTETGSCEGDCGDRYKMNVQSTVRQVVHPVPADFAGTRIRSIRHRLPVGRAMRFLKDSPDDLAEYWLNHHDSKGITIIGDGNEHVLRWNEDIAPHNNDGMSYYVVFDFNIDIGYIQLFDEDGFGGRYDYIFPEYYETGTVHSMSGWNIMSAGVGSIKFDGLGDTVSVELFKNTDEPDQRVTVNGWVDDSNNEIPDLAEHDLKNEIRGFRWLNREAVKTEILSIEIDFPDGVPTGKTYTFFDTGINGLSTETELTAAISQELSHEVSGTLESTHTFASSIWVSYTVKVEGFIAEVEKSATFTLSFERSETKSETETERTSTEVERSQTIVIPPRTMYQVSYAMTEQRIPRVRKELEVIRYFDFPIPNSVAETVDDRLLWKRQDFIWVILEGAVGYDVSLNTDYQSMDC